MTLPLDKEELIWENGQNIMHNCRHNSVRHYPRNFVVFLSSSLDSPCTGGRSYTWENGILDLGGIGKKHNEMKGNGRAW